MQSLTNKNNRKYIERKFVGKFCIPNGGTHPYDRFPRKHGQLAAFNTLRGSCVRDACIAVYCVATVIQLTLTSCFAPSIGCNWLWKLEDT
jgi:hypothetical protein